MIGQDELLTSFVEESLFNLQSAEPDLLKLEKKADEIDSETVNSIFRKIHSVKGAAGFFGFKNIGSLSHVMESLLSLLRNGEIKPETELIDALLSGVDVLKAMVEDIESSEAMDVQTEIETLQRLLDKSGGSTAKTITVQKKPTDSKKEPGIGKFQISEKDLKYYIAKGYYIYAIKIYLNKDLRNKGNTPFSFINTMESLGQYIDSFLNIGNVSGLSDCLENDLAFDFLFATVLEPDLVPKGLELPEDRVSIIDLDHFIKTAGEEAGAGPQKDEISKTTPADSAPIEKKAAETETPPVRQPESQLSNIAETDTRPVPGEPETPKPAERIEDSRPGEVPPEPADGGADKIAHSIYAEEKIRVGVNFLNDLVNLAGELVLGRNQLMQATLPLVKTTPGLNPVLQHISRVTSEMQEKIMQMRMQPISLIISKFHRLVRSMAKSLKKEIRLVTYGEDVELDKTIIEGLSDPLTHLIRNAIDHGIEEPDEREQAGKPRQGTVELHAYHQGGQVHLKISDDGKGLDGGEIGRIAVEKGIVTNEQISAMTETDLVKLIFKPGFSTAEKVTDVSGRGVGMDVVLTNIEHMGGTVDIDSKPGEGTVITLMLPLTLAIVSGLLIQEGGHFFILPEGDIDELVRVKPEEIRSKIDIVQNALVLRLRDMLPPLISLSQVLGLSEESVLNFSELKEPLRILILRYGKHRFGLIVDTIVSIEEIVVKPLPRYLKKMKCFSGVSILGNGTVSLILDISGIVKKAAIDQIKITDAEAAARTEKSADLEKDIQTLLLFDNNTPEQFALPLELISRIERTKLSRIEKIKDKQFLQYHGKKLRLVFLEDYLPVTRPERSSDDMIGVIVPKQLQNPMGIVIHRVINTVNTAVELDTKTISSPGLFGSSVINDRITLIPDMYKLFELVAPEWYVGKNQDVKKKKSRPKILLVEDTPFFRMVESEYLTSAGYDVVTAENGRIAMQVLDEQKVDGVVLDIIMPKMDGWEVIKAIRSDERLKNLPVMAVSSLSDDASIQEGLKAGFNEWESKLNKTSLLSKLESILQI